jgi:hypothetical protein
MNPIFLPSEMSVSNQERILRELQQLPNDLLKLRAKIDESNREITGAKNKLLEAEHWLENERTNYILSPEFQECKNDIQRKAFIFSMTQDFEQQVVIVRQLVAVCEAKLQEHQAQYELTYHNLWALKSASGQIAAYMNFAAAGELL